MTNTTRSRNKPPLREFLSPEAQALDGRWEAMGERSRAELQACLRFLNDLPRAGKALPYTGRRASSDASTRYFTQTYIRWESQTKAVSTSQGQVHAAPVPAPRGGAVVCRQALSSTPPITQVDSYM